MRTSILSRKSLSRKSLLGRVLLPALFWLGVWWLLAWVIGQDLLLPSPWRVAKELAQLSVTAIFWQNVAASLLRIFSGLLFGTLGGLLLAVACWHSVWLDLLISPAIRVIRATPVASFIILLLLWVKGGTVPGVIAALMVLPIIWESVLAGLVAVDKNLLEMASAYQMSRLRQIRYVYLPSMLPGFLAAVCTAIGLAWKSGVAAEVLCLPKLAIGAKVYYGKIYLETPSLFAWTITVVVLSLLLESLVRHLVGGNRVEP